MHERSLHIHAQHHPEQDQVDPETLGGWTEQRDDDEGDLEEVEEEREQENEHVDEDEEAELAPGHRDQHFLDPAVPVHAVEGEREHARANQDEHHEGRELGGRLDRLSGQIEAQAALHQGENECAGCPMAPPSVGVATPMKIVPNTRKISASGGTITNVTCAAMAEISRKPVVRSMTAATNE